MEYCIVLDYSTGIVHIHKVDLPNDIEVADVITKLGYEVNWVYCMFCSELTIKNHDEILHI